MPSDIKEVSSPTHMIQTINESPKRANVMFIKDCEAMDKDLIVNFRTRTPHQSRAILEKGSISTISNPESASVDQAAMVTFVPQFVLNDINAEFIFVVDRSGSMEGNKMEQTRNALELFLRALPAWCYFNTIGFGSSYTKLFQDGSQPYTERNVSAAYKHIASMNADLGGTDFMGPLLDIYYKKNPVPKNYLRQIIVLTDGAVANTEEVVRLVVDNHKCTNWRLFTIGVGASVSRALVKGMAIAGKGTCQIIPHNARVEPQVMLTLKQALQPSLMNVRVEWGTLGDATTGYPIVPPKTGCLVGHRVNEYRPPNASKSNSVRNNLVYQVSEVISTNAMAHLIVHISLLTPYLRSTLAKGLLCMPSFTQTRSSIPSL